MGCILNQRSNLKTYVLIFCQVFYYLRDTRAILVPESCNQTLPCQSGHRLPDPEDCLFYYECDQTESSYTKKQCDAGKLFHATDLKCRKQKNVIGNCAEACNDENSNLKIEHILASSSDNSTSANNTTLSTVSKPTSTPLNKLTTVAISIAEKDYTTVMDSTVTKRVTTEKANIVVPVSVSQEPPYLVVTDDVVHDNHTSNASAVIPPKNDENHDDISSAIIGIIAGVVVGVILLGAVVLVMILMIRRRKQQKSSNITKIENPQYTTSADDKPHNYRFSRDSALYVGPTHAKLKVNFSKLNNNVQMSNEDSLTRKKRPAPTVPAANQHLLRKKGPAPPPPNPFGTIDEDEGEEKGDETSAEETKAADDMYEKDSHDSSENIAMSTFTAKNERASFKDKHDTAKDERASFTDKHDTAKDESINKDTLNDDEEEESFTNDNTTRPLISKENSARPISNGKIPKPSEQNKDNTNISDDDSDDSSDDDDDDQAKYDQSQALIENKDKSQSKGNVSEDISLDDYDKTMNPFFAD